MKKQNDPAKTKYYTMYKERQHRSARVMDMIESIPKRCWWLRQYLRGTMFARKGRSYARNTD